MAQKALQATDLHPNTHAHTLPRLNLGGRPLMLVALAVLLVGVFLLALAVGSAHVPFDQIITILMSGEAERASWENIILKVRVPRALTAALAGAALSVGGLLLQTFFRNPLADPFILGISSGASLGVALVVLISSAGAGAVALAGGISIGGNLGTALAASFGAGVTLLIVLAVARKVNHPTTLLILGLMFGYFTGAVVSFLMHFSVPERVQAFVSWGFGSFSGVTWGQLEVLAPVVLMGLALAFVLAKPLDALLLGEAYARSMGLNVPRARVLIVIVTGILAGAVTAFCGPIGFVGVAVPHLARALLQTSHHRTLIPAVILLGGVVALLAGIVSEMPGSHIVLPLNAVTALFGAPVVMWVIVRGRSWHGGA